MKRRADYILWFLIPFTFAGCQSDEPVGQVKWVLSELVESIDEGSILGSPNVEASTFGESIVFNGIDEAIILNDLPIDGLSQFTIEAIIRPDSGGLKEQRFLHMGELRGDRVLFETRITDTHWYFDAFIKSGEEGLALIDSTLLHPLNQWYHVALVVDNGLLRTYINGNQELEGRIDFSPVSTGRTSIGVRQNREYWYKGAIDRIIISPRVLQVQDFFEIFKS